MTSTTAAPQSRTLFDKDHPRYKWVALSNTTLGMLMATINASIVLISLPAIFNGIHLNALDPANTSYLLWMLMGFLLVSAVVVVGFGRLGDMLGRVRIYNLGFVIFTITSIALSLDPYQGGAGALWLILWRVAQGFGAAMLFANSTAILTDAFPAERRGMALGINQIAAIAGSFIGLVLGGVLSAIDWHWVFLVNVPIGILGTVWSYKSLHEIGTKNPGSLDIPGNLVFLLGLTALLTGITYGIQPYGSSATGWTNPWVLSAIIGGIVLLGLFAAIELRRKSPMFELRLFKSRAFSMASLAGLMASIGRGGLQFMLIIWLQGIWLPLHGYSYESTPLWAGIYLLPLTAGFLISGPLSGVLSDRIGARPLATLGMLVTAATFVGLLLIPVDFQYWVFALITFANGIGSGMFGAPNRVTIMSAVPANQRGSASGMAGTILNAGSSLSIGIFFSLMIAGLAGTLPSTLRGGLVAHSVPAAAATQVANVPPVGTLFSAFLGYNPIQTLLGPTGVLKALPAADSSTLTGKEFFPNLISGPFHTGLVVVFLAAAVLSVIGAVASFAVGRVPSQVPTPATGAEARGEAELASADRGLGYHVAVAHARQQDAPERETVR